MISYDNTTTVNFTVSGSTYYSPSFIIDGTTTYSFQLVYSDGVGTVQVQHSNNKINWASLIPDTSLTISGSDNAIFDIGVTGAKFTRLFFSSGDGTVCVLTLNEKEL